jgi:hypothetical protein
MQLDSPSLKLIMKSSNMNGHTSPLNNDNEPVKKKQRLEDSSSLVPSYSQSNSIDEQSVPSPSSLINNIKKKKKKKSHHLPSLITNGQHQKTKNHHLASFCDKISMQ